MTTRRLFDALAAGCVPVLLKSIGNAPHQWLLGSNPFQHSLNWPALALFLAPRRVRASEREDDGMHVKDCRSQEAAWLDARHDDAQMLAMYRRRAAEAFHAHLDVEFRPHGVVHALLREMSYVLDDDCDTRRYITAFNNAHPLTKMSKNGFLFLPARRSLLDEPGIAIDANATGCKAGEILLMEQARINAKQERGGIAIHHPSGRWMAGR